MFAFLQKSHQPQQQAYQPPSSQRKQDSEDEPPAGQVINDILEDDTFEEINESREIVEDRINRLKLQMIDFTVKQHDISEKIASLRKDIELLQTKCDDLSQQQANAIEAEDYNLADSLNLRLTQTKNLIISKEAQIKRHDEDHMNLEGQKLERTRDLAGLINKSIEKVENIRTRQELEMS